MTQLIVYSAGRPSEVELDITEFAAISEKVAVLGANIERWQASHELAADASDADILRAYEAEINRLKRERGYTNADVVRILPGNPNWPVLRNKFSSEHTHDEDEVRFFVEGTGAFYLHVGDKIYQVVGTPGDLLSVPKGTKHWFDGGAEASFTVIRLFTEQVGWTPLYTGDRISDSVPHYKAA